MDGVQEYALRMDPGDLKWFRSHVGTDRCFPATLAVGGKEWPVYIGYRGMYSRRFRKPSYDLWFADGPAMGGHARLHLNAAYRDPALLRGRLSLQIFSELGVPTPQAWHIWLTMNGEDRGLYSAIESLDAAWFDRQGLPPGAIYYAVGSEGNFGLLDPDTGRPKGSVTLGYEKCYPYDSDHEDLESLVYRITLPGDEEFEAHLEAVLDVETVLRWMVGLEFTNHTDGLVQNYALFRTDGGRWRISPWDCDGTWGRMPDGYPITADDMPVGTGEDNILLARLMASPRWRRRYLELWEDALAGPLAPEHLDRTVKAIYKEIRPYALKDWRKRRSDWLFLRQPAEIRRFAGERKEYVLERLAALRSRTKR